MSSFDPSNPDACSPNGGDNNNNDNSNGVVQGFATVGSYIATLANWMIHFATVILPFVLAFAIVYFVANKVTLPSVLIMGLLAMMIYIFFNNMTGSNLAGSLPAATYPIPPHLGLDGISLTNRSDRSF